MAFAMFLAFFAFFAVKLRCVLRVSRHRPRGRGRYKKMLTDD